jgi:hypothetical protein
VPRPARLNVSDSVRPRQQVFDRAKPVHMYAAKETSTAGIFNIDRRDVTWERAKITGRRLWSDRAARYYFGASTIAVFVAYQIVTYSYAEMEDEQGLVGPKRKQYKSRLTVVLDVDETLISFGDKAFRLRGTVKPRPYLAELLDYLAKIDAEVVLWSASSDRYMRAVLMAVDPAGLRIDHYLTREGNWFVADQFYEKNLRWLKRDLKDTIFIENRAMSVRSCNNNSILVEDFIRGEYMDTGRDFPHNDRALLTVKEICQELHENGRPVHEYIADKKNRHKDIKQLPCHMAIKQMPDELAVGEFFFIGNKYRPTQAQEREIANAVLKSPV